jgi:pentatricopeptide repeat-containing protein PET309
MAADTTPTENCAVEDQATPHWQELAPATSSQKHEAKQPKHQNQYDFSGRSSAWAYRDYSASAGRSGPDLLVDLMQKENGHLYDEVWDEYTRLEDDIQCLFRRDVIEYLARARGTAQAERILSIFKQLSSASWTNETVTIVVAIMLRLELVRDALATCKTALSERSLVGGIDNLLAYALKVNGWDILKELWIPYSEKEKATRQLPIELSEVAALPDLGRAVLRAYKSLEAEQEKPNAEQGLAQGEFEAMENLLVRAAASAINQPCRPSDAPALLAKLRNKAVYHNYIRTALGNKQTQFLPAIYRAFRALDGVRINQPILHGMFDVFYPHDIQGLEEIFEDYHRIHGSLDFPGHLRYLKLYSKRGDLKSLGRVWNSLVSRYQGKGVLKRPETWNILLNAYAERIEVDEVERRFAEMKDFHGVEPDVQSWNIRMKVYVLAKKYDKVLAVFDELCATVEPDSYSYGTLMSMSGNRGDLDFTLQLAQRAKSEGIPISTTMVTAVVKAYLHHRRVKEAILACIKLSTAKLDSGALAPAWNVLLRHLSLSGSLTSVYRVLGLMSEHGVAWDAITYEHLLRALVICRQVDHAYKLLQVAFERKAFAVTPKHCAVVMGGALRVKQWGLVKGIKNWMQNNGLELPADTLLNVADATLNIKSIRSSNGRRLVPTTEQQAMSRTVVGHYRKMMATAKANNSVDGDQPLDSQTTMLGQPLRPYSGDYASTLRDTSLMSRSLRLLGKLNDFNSVEELATVYSSLYPSSRPGEENLPADVLASLMTSDFDAGNFGRVRIAWDFLFAKALESGRSPSTSEGEILPGHQWDLVAPFKVMLRVVRAERDADAILGLVYDVTKEGFKLDNPCYNYVVRDLLELRRWKEAFKICETMLMEGWTGWALERQQRHGRAVSLWLSYRRQHARPRHLRPISYTMILLAAEFKKFSEAAPWNPDSQVAYSFIEENCPRITRAIRTMVYSGSGIEAKLFGRGSGEAPPQKYSQFLKDL